ncbi:TPA_asm: antibiotic biosynthesis monooxygenase, partial [Listeria monocytogenes]|nr:antibiotic biosynthesis monooxygenase [Listeria monocytogenes]
MKNVENKGVIIFLNGIKLKEGL